MSLFGRKDLDNANMASSTHTRTERILIRQHCKSMTEVTNMQTGEARYNRVIKAKPTRLISFYYRSRYCQILKFSNQINVVEGDKMITHHHGKEMDK